MQWIKKSLKYIVAFFLTPQKSFAFILQTPLNIILFIVVFTFR